MSQQRHTLHAARRAVGFFYTRVHCAAGRIESTHVDARADQSVEAGAVAVSAIPHPASDAACSSVLPSNEIDHRSPLSADSRCARKMRAT